MKINWDKWKKIDRGRILFGGCLSIFVAMMFFYIDFTKPVIKNKADIFFITGPFKEYNWVNYSKGSSLTFRLTNYKNDFKIKADFFKILKADQFKNIPSGEILSVGIPIDFKKYLNSEIDPFFIYSISSNKADYLDYEDAIKVHNSNFIKIASSIFLLSGLVAIYIWFKIK